jgi:very-short-patch-repair endonuclease
VRGELPHRTNRARALRSVTTAVEVRLWHRLRDRRLGGFKFVRQAPLGRYYVDFLCREARLVVELDGSQHAENPNDRQRDADLAALGYRVFRVWNNDISGRLDNVLERLLLELAAAPLPPASTTRGPPSPRSRPLAGEGI